MPEPKRPGVRDSLDDVVARILRGADASPGRQVSRFAMRGDKTLFRFVFRDEYMSGGEAKPIVSEAFAGSGWEWPQIERELARTSDLYFETVSQVRMDRWTSGRTALVGDAAACVSLMAGEGTGPAIAEAYILAGGLHSSGGDFRAAFARYEQRSMPFLRRKQSSAANFASSFASKTSFGIALRSVLTELMRVPSIAELFIGRDLRDDIELPDYEIARS
ncbi:MAG TPA: hypothetical protein VNM68_03355 [Candidatus Polarisedimenticolia bacterium]|nr:hypothetical protein [Candidatus Polarisedimenticolia bacterium]